MVNDKRKYALQCRPFLEKSFQPLLTKRGILFLSKVLFLPPKGLGKGAIKRFAGLFFLAGWKFLLGGFSCPL
jgi:hypothetical protein